MIVTAVATAQIGETHKSIRIAPDSLANKSVALADKMAPAAE